MSTLCASGPSIGHLFVLGRRLRGFALGRNWSAALVLVLSRFELVDPLEPDPFQLFENRSDMVVDVVLLLGKHCRRVSRMVAWGIGSEQQDTHGSTRPYDHNRHPTVRGLQVRRSSVRSESKDCGLNASHTYTRIPIHRDVQPSIPWSAGETPRRGGCAP